MNLSKKQLMFNFLFVCFAFVAFTGCKENKAGSKNLEAINTNATSDNTACFEQYKTELMKILTKDEIASVYQVDLVEAELKSSIKNKYSRNASYIYLWPGDPDRSERIMGNGKDLGPKKYRIGVGYLDFYNRDSKYIINQFKNEYNLTDARKAEAREAISKELEKDGAEPKTKSTSKSITSSIVPELKFSSVEGIGDAAVWSHIKNGLIVLKGNAQFTVIVDVSDERQENIDLAKKLAKIILDKCE